MRIKEEIQTVSEGKYLIRCCIYLRKSKGKAVSLQAWTDPKGSKKLRLPDFVTTVQAGLGCQPYAPAAFTPRKYSWYSFLLEAESTPGP